MGLAGVPLLPFLVSSQARHLSTNTRASVEIYLVHNSDNCASSTSIVGRAVPISTIFVNGSVTTGIIFHLFMM